MSISGRTGVFCKFFCCCSRTLSSVVFQQVWHSFHVGEKKELIIICSTPIHIKILLLILKNKFCF